jgi:hypothetical protein
MIRNKKQKRFIFWQPYNKNSFLVDSEKRDDVKHLVDFEGFDGEPVSCSCEAFTLGKQKPCRHIKLLIETFA